VPKLGRNYQGRRMPAGPTATTGPTLNHEGAPAFQKDAKSALYTLILTNMVSEETFYEQAGDRDRRFRDLVHQCAVEDPDWTRALIGWARGEGNMRTAPLVAACEYIRGWHVHDKTVPAPEAARLVAEVCQRADEPGEILAYWDGSYGRPFPRALLTGVRHAVERLYTDRALVKWDSDKAPFRFGDVIELTHPKPLSGYFSGTWKRAIDERHNRAELSPAERVDEYRSWIVAGAPLEEIPTLATWENLSAHHKMDAAAWQAVIPQMGYMALLRNLRNFEQAGVDTATLNAVAAKIADPAEVARSRQFPFRFWSAWKHSGTMRFGRELEEALTWSCHNVPDLAGRTLVMVDVSGSMHAPMSGKSKLQAYEAAQLFGAVVHSRAEDSVLAAFASTADTYDGPRHSVLRTVEAFSALSVGAATYTWQCAGALWVKSGPFDRIVIVTDEQAYSTRWGGQAGPASVGIPARVPIYSWDLRGYQTTSFELGSGRYQLGGLSDASFRLIPLLESSAQGWPWETATA
jgi:hypothetical protein